MEIGAIPQVLEDVLGLGKGGLADPGHSFAAHMGEGLGAPVHPGGHIVTADPPQSPAAVGYHRRGIVGTAGAEMGGTLQGGPGLGQSLLLGLQKGQPLFHPLAVVEAANAGGDHPGDPGRGQFPGGGQNPVALLVELADYPGADVLPPVVELLFKLVFDHRPLFLHHQHLLQAPGEVADTVSFQGPDHGHLIDSQTDSGGLLLIDAQIFQGLHHIQIGFTGGDDTKAGLGAVHDNPVQPVGLGEGQGGIELITVQPFLLGQGLIGPADAETVRGHLEVIGGDDFHPVGIDGHRGRGVYVFGDGLKADPAAGKA